MVHFGGIVARDFVSDVIGDENAKRGLYLNTKKLSVKNIEDTC